MLFAYFLWFVIIDVGVFVVLWVCWIIEVDFVLCLGVGVEGCVGVVGL